MAPRRRPGISADSTAIAVVALLCLAGCTVVHERPDTGDRWTTDRSVERDENKEDDELVFALQSDDYTATFQRLKTAYREAVFPRLVALHAGVDVSEVDSVAFKPRGETIPKGRLLTIEGDDELISRRYFVYTADGATSLLTWKTRRPDHAEDADTFQTLLGGLEPSHHENAEPVASLELRDGLEQAELVDIEPVDNKGSPRTAAMQTLSFPPMMTTGQLLDEPLLATVDADTYVSTLKKRLEIDDSTVLEADDCVADCGGVQWVGAEHQRRHLIAVIVDDERAYQLRLAHPIEASTAFDEIIDRWLVEFWSDPSALFDEDDIADGKCRGHSTREVHREN